MLLNCGIGEDSWESLGLQGDPTSPSQGKSVLNIHWKDWCWSWNSNTLATWCEELTLWKRPWCWERLKVAGEGDNRGWDGWIASPTQWTWVWVSSRSWWRTGKPGMLQSAGSQRVGLKWATELNWMKIIATSFKSSHAHTAALSAPNLQHATADPCLCQTPGHSWASLGQCLVGSQLFSPGSWCAQGFICALKESVSPVLCKF